MVDDLKYFDGELAEIKRIPEAEKKIFLTSFDIEPKWLIACAMKRQKWIDMGQSLNLYMAQPSGKKLDAMYKLAWQAGLKTTYYLRSLGATNAEKSTLDKTRGVNSVSAGDVLAGPVNGTPNGKSREETIAGGAIKASIVKDGMDTLNQVKTDKTSRLDAAAASARLLSEREAAIRTGRRQGSLFHHQRRGVRSMPMNWDDENENSETPSVFGGSTQSATMSACDADGACGHARPAPARPRRGPGPAAASRWCSPCPPRRCRPT